MGNFVAFLVGRSPDSSMGTGDQSGGLFIRSASADLEMPVCYPGIALVFPTVLKNITE